MGNMHVLRSMQQSKVVPAIKALEIAAAHLAYYIIPKSMLNVRK